MDTMIMVDLDKIKQIVKESAIEAANELLIGVINIPMRDNRFYNMKDLCKKLGVSKRYIVDAVKAGVIKPGYFVSPDSKVPVYDAVEVFEQIKSNQKLVSQLQRAQTRKRNENPNG